MYTLDTILADCVGRYIAAQGGRVQLNNLINSRTYADCWGAMLRYARVCACSAFSGSNIVGSAWIERQSIPEMERQSIPETRRHKFTHSQCAANI